MTFKYSKRQVLTYQRIEYGAKLRLLACHCMRLQNVILQHLKQWFLVLKRIIGFHFGVKYFFLGCSIDRPWLAWFQRHKTTQQPVQLPILFDSSPNNAECPLYARHIIELNLDVLIYPCPQGADRFGR